MDIVHRPLHTLSLALVFAITLSACSGMFFFPARKHVQTPDQLGLKYRDITLSAADDTQLHAWLLPATKPARGNILFLHGNAENISTHIYNVRWLPAAGYQVLLLDYRGFGQSQGSAQLPEVFLDIDAALNWFTEDPDAAEKDLFILGQSIGASLMFYAATQHTGNPELCGLVSDAAFTGYGDIIRHVAAQSWISWPFQYPLSWGRYGRYDPINAVSELDALPILFFHSRDDQIIPFSNLDPLIAKHSGTHQRAVTEGPHTATFGRTRNRDTLIDFLSKHSCTTNIPSQVSQDANLRL